MSSLSSHFKRSPVPAEVGDLSWLSAASFTPVGLSDAREKNPETKSPKEPAEVIPSKGISTYMKSARFNAYKSTRPALLQAINAHVENGLRQLRLQYGEDIPKRRALDVYSSAFDMYIDESTLYKPILTSVKKCYDDIIEEDRQRAIMLNDVDALLQDRDDQHAQRIEKTNQDWQVQVKDLEAKLNAAQMAAKESATKISKLTLENSKLTEAGLHSKREADAAKTTNGLLATQLARLAEDKLKSDAADAAMQVELAHIKQSEATLNAEMERLHEALAQKEAIHATLVSPDVLATLRAEMELTRRENKRVAATHRQLLMRYTAVKFMIDGSLKRIDDAKQLELEAPHIGKAKVSSALMGVFAEYRAVMVAAQKKEALLLREPADKILELVRESVYPRVIFESLLDQIERLQTENRRLLYGDGDDGMSIDGVEGMSINEDGDITDNIPADAFFEGLGFGENVPSYLRYEGNIHNIKISRRTTIDLVHEICAAKAAHEAMGIAPASIILPVNPPADGKPERSADSDSDLDSIDSQNLRSRGGTAAAGTTSAANSPSRVPQSPHTQALFTSVRSGQSGRHGAPTQVSGERSLSSIDSRVEVYVPSLPSLPSNCTMAEFFECFLQDKVRDHFAAVEVAYNIVHALKRHAGSNQDCKLFTAMLAGEIQFAIWVDRVAVVEKLRAAVHKENSSNTRAADGEWKLLPDKFMKVVKKVLNTWKEEDLESLREVMQAEQSPDSRYVNGSDLLYDGEDGERAPFLEMVKAQHLEDCLSMEKIVLGCIEQICDPGGPEVRIALLREALALSDANKTRLEINLLLARGAGCSLEAILLKEAKRVPVLLEEFKQNIKNGLLKKSPPPAARPAGKKAKK